MASNPDLERLSVQIGLNLEFIRVSGVFRSSTSFPCPESFSAPLGARKCLSPTNHISKTHPEWVKQIGKFLWLDPGEKGVQNYSLAVIMDVLRRYDIDGVQLDDYFYPENEDLDLPDDASW